jgi:hypothetical protein
VSSRGSAWLREERDAYVFGLLRCALGVLLFLQASRALSDWWDSGYFGDYWHLPIVPASLVPSHGVYAGLLAFELVAAACAIAGVWSRAALLGSSTTGLYLLLCDRLQYHNNRYALLLIAFLTAFTPCDRSFSARRGARALSPEARRAPTWARRLVQAQVSLIYGASALGKLADPDWRGGQVLAIRYLHTLSYLASQGVRVPRWLADVYTSPWYASATAKGAISLELFLALGLWQPRTRRFALWLGVLFHFGIELSARVELFSWLMWTAYLAFVTPECRERLLEVDPRSRVARLATVVLRRLDILARFDVHENADLLTSAGSIVRVTDRSGHAHTGWAAYAQIASAFPPLFAAWPLLAMLATFRERRQRSAAAP